MKSTIFILLIGLFSVLISCEKETHENLYKGLLKRKLVYWSVQDTSPKSISDYEYDSKLRLRKIQDNLYTELFEYNQNDELIRKFTYQTDGGGTTLYDTTFYKYQEGKLVYEESIHLPPSSYSSSLQTKYEYENSKLIRKTKYRNHVFEGLTVYEYSGDLCSKELNFRDSTAVQIESYRGFGYDKSKLLMSTLVGFASGDQKYMLQTVYYIYDDSGNLIIEYAIQDMEISAWISYCYRYEYY